MLKVAITCVGRLKEPYFIAAAAEYEKRLQRYCHFSSHEYRDDDSLASALTRANATVVLLDETGDSLSSQEFAQEILGGHERKQARSPLFFAIGGADGHCSATRALAARTLSFGRATLGHRIARLVLIEQVYRGFCILRGHPYHRE